MPSPHKRSFAAEELKRRQRKKPWIWVVVSVLAITLIIGGFLYVRMMQQKQVETEEKITSIAVLPFENITADEEQEHLCRGIAESIRTALTNVGNLHVAASTSSSLAKEKGYDIEEIGKKLNVQSVLEGSLQKSGNRLRIYAQLINVKNGFHLWSQTFESTLDDIFSTQDKIAQTIVEKLDISVNRDERATIMKRYTENTEAYNLYLEGRYHWNKRREDELKKGLTCFQQAIEKDPKFALAYVGIADTYNILGFWGYRNPHEVYPQSKTAAEKALSIDHTLAEAHVSLADVLLYNGWDWSAAEKELLLALTINPDYSTAHQWYSDYLVIMGRFDEALGEARRALELDPLSPVINYCVADRYLHLKRYNEAMEQCDKTIEIDPYFGHIYWCIGNIYLEQGKFNDAITAYEKAIELSGDFAMVKGSLGYTYAMAGEKDKSKKILEELQKRKMERYISSFEVAMIYLGLSDENNFFEMMERAYRERDHFMPFLMRFFKNRDGIRTDPRFKALLKKMRLPES